MSLEGCIKKAGRALDSQDKEFLENQKSLGKSDKEALAALEANIKVEQQEIAAEAESQGVVIRRGADFDLGEPPTDLDANEGVQATVRYLNYAVYAILNSRIENKGKTIATNFNQLMRERFPLYADAADKLVGVYNDSSALQQLVHTITGNNVDKLKKSDVLSIFARITRERDEVINHQLNKFEKLLKPLSDPDRANLNDFVTQLPLHDYFLLAPDLVTAAEIDEELDIMEKDFKKHHAGALIDINSLVDLNVRGELTGQVYNLDTNYPLNDSVFGDKARKLLALKSINAIGTRKFAKLLKNTELMNLVKDQVVANRLSLMDNGGVANLRDNLLPDYYKESPQLKAIELKDYPMYQTGENTGWKVVRPPTKNTLGIVAKETIDATSIVGAFTDIKLSSTDINVSGKKANFEGVAQTRDGFKLVLTPEEKKGLGLIQDFSQALVRGTAHSMAIKESQIIRDELLKNETRMIIKDKEAKNLVEAIGADNIDNPWFVKMAEGMNYVDLPKAVKAKYMPVGNRASNVKGFDENVDLVRKDISHWLLGDGTSSLFQNPRMKWVTRIVKHLVSGAKIGMIVLNPAKIARDNISNVTYLSMMGVSPQFIATNYADIQKDFSDYQDLQRQIIQLKVQLTAHPESAKLKKRIKSLQDRVKKNPVGDIGDKGFVNSLGSDLVSRNADTLSGMQADMHTALEYLLTRKDGKRNFASHFINQLHKLGFNGEDFLTYIGRTAGKFDSGKGMERELDRVHERLSKIRDDDDVINYVSQYTTSPSSEAVRLGSNLTDLTDVLAKETLWRHLVEVEGLSPEAAQIKVLDSFPDYKENLPLAIKQLSDLGIIMFPSFWLRIQKVIYRLARDKPINLATEIMLQEAFDSDIDTILDANIVNKSNTFGGLFHTPLEPIGAGSFLPTHIF